MSLATQFGMAGSIICIIPKNKEMIKKANVAKGMTLLHTGMVKLN